MTPTVYGIDAGGSHSLVSVERPGTTAQRSDAWERPSFAIATAGPAEAAEHLGRMLDEVASAALDGPFVGCIASSAMPMGAEAPLPDLLVGTIRAHAPRGWVVLVNDVLPLLFTGHLQGVGLAVSSGTGSSVIGRGPSGELLKVGGHEYILSDEGSAYSLAREGLRQAVRYADGLGEPTSLRLAAERFFDRPMSAVGRWLAELPRARRTVASFAPEVTAAAEAGDRVAQGVVVGEADKLVESVQFATIRLGLGHLPPIGLAGGVFWNSALWRERFESTLQRRGLTDAPRSNIRLVDGVGASLSFARVVAEQVAAGKQPEAPAGLLVEIP